MQPKHEIIREYLKRFPDHADLTMAKKIYAENPLLWDSVETISHLLNQRFDLTNRWLLILILFYNFSF